jgi:LysM repeat protein
MAMYRATPRRRRPFPWIPTVAVVAVVGIGLGLWYWGTRGPAELEQNEAPAAPPTGLLTASEPLSPMLPTDEAEAEDTDELDPEVAAADSPDSATDQPPDEILEPRPASAPALAQETTSVEPTSSGPTIAAEDKPQSATGGLPTSAVAPQHESQDVSPGERATIAAARRRHESGQVIEARQELNALLRTDLSPAGQAEVRRLLTRLADETVFSKARLADDPLIETYAIQSGDVLINVGRRYDVPAGAIMRINGIKDARRIRAQQEIKVPRGPFNLRIYKSQFRMDVYLQDLYVRSFPVGVGANASTPEGVWRVKNRLPNPTFYPPPSADDKRIIAADDPKNPLGEHWIGLEYVEGNAVNTDKYGIHGTIEPESIGRNASLGCVRMHNQDVAFVFDLVQPGRSTVTILP